MPTSGESLNFKWRKKRKRGCRLRGDLRCSQHRTAIQPAENRKQKKSMNAEQQKAYRERLEKIAAARKIDWASQEAHKILACLVVMDLAKIKEAKERDRVLIEFMTTDSAMGANASAFAQKLGRPGKAEKAMLPFTAAGL